MFQEEEEELGNPLDPNNCKPCFNQKSFIDLFYTLVFHVCFHLEKKGALLFFFFKLENPYAWNSTELHETSRGKRKKINNFPLQENDSQ